MYMRICVYAYMRIASVCCWLLISGCWLLAVGCWLLVFGCWLFVGCWFLVVCCFFVVGWLFYVLIFFTCVAFGDHTCCVSPKPAGLQAQR